MRAKGWKRIGASWYFFDTATAAMRTGWGRGSGGRWALTLRRDRQADALFRIALALRSSRTSNAGSLIRCASSVVVPGRVPWSIWAFLTQVRRASGWTPSSSAILRIASLARAGSANTSNAILLARSRSSSEYFFMSHDSDPSVSSLPPTNPGRFIQAPRAALRTVGALVHGLASPVAISHRLTMAGDTWNR